MNAIDKDSEGTKKIKNNCTDSTILESSKESYLTLLNNWKSKQKDQVCHSSKDAGTLNLMRMVDDAVLTSRQLELFLYGDIMHIIL